MDTRLILVVVCAWAVCHVTHAQLQTPSTLQSNITFTDCGTSKLCMWNIANCDPSGNSSCFVSSIQMVNQTAVIQLSGTTSGYVGLGLTGNQSEGNIVFICGSNDSNINNTSLTMFFNTFTQNGTTMTPANVSNVNNVQGLVKQNLIQCTFTISTNLTINNDKNMIISNTTAFFIKLLTGNGTNVGEASPVISSTAPVSLTKPTVLSNLPISSPPTNVTTNTTQPPINITRDGCNTMKLCVSTPSACEPAGSNCTFTSFKVTNQTLFCELSGRSPGYIAVALTVQNYTSVFICSNNNNSFFFQTATLNGTALTSTNLTSVYSFQGQVTENRTLIQCKFNTSISNNSFSTVTLFSGTDLEKPNILLTKSLNVSNPIESITLTPGAPTTSAGNSVVSRWTEVMAVLLSAMSLYFVTSPSP